MWYSCLNLSKSEREYAKSHSFEECKNIPVYRDQLTYTECPFAELLNCLPCKEGRRYIKQFDSVYSALSQCDNYDWYGCNVIGRDKFYAFVKSIVPNEHWPYFLGLNSTYSHRLEPYKKEIKDYILSLA